MAARIVTDDQRRARLVARHRLAGGVPDVRTVGGELAALHSSDPATPYLSIRARLDDFATADLDRELFERRSLWRLHAMRRTLFVVPTRDAGVFLAAGREVAARERDRVAGWIADERGEAAAGELLDRGTEAILEELASGEELSTAELAERAPVLATEIPVGRGTWATRGPLGSRLCFLVAMEGRIVRTRPVGSWRASQYRWAATEAWFGAPPPTLDPVEGRRLLARRYLERFGPVTLTDLRWWTGWTARDSKAALEGLEVERVALEHGQEGMLLAGDVDPVPEPPPSPALLPSLDPTPMGWKQREWYLGDHADALFDRNGNVGPTIWIGGRIVGGWGQRSDGAVVWSVLEEVGSEAERAIEQAAAEVDRWLGETVVIPRFRTPLEQELTR